MRIALSSYSGYGAWFILRLLMEGHSVDYFLSKPEYADILEGIVPSPFLPSNSRLTASPQEISHLSHLALPGYIHKYPQK